MVAIRHQKADREEFIKNELPKDKYSDAQRRRFFHPVKDDYVDGLLVKLGLKKEEDDAKDKEG